MAVGIPYELALAFVLTLAVAVFLLFVFLLGQREAITLVTAYARRREVALAPLVHRALTDPAVTLELRVALRRFDLWVVRELLLRLALDLRGEEATRIARLFRELGLLDHEVIGLRSRRWRRRVAAAANLGTVRVPGSFRALLPALEDRVMPVRLAAVRALGDLGTQEALAALIPMLGDLSPAVSRQTQDILAERGGKVAREIRGYVRQSGSRRGRLAAIELLGWHRAPEAARLLLELTREEDHEVRVKAVKAAAAIGDPRFLEVLHALVTDPTWEVRCHAARGLGLLGSPESAPRLRPLLRDRHWWVRYRAAEALAELGPPGRALLEEARGDADPRAGEMARYVLERGVVPVLPA
jgi:HEAT repeat protein